MNKQEIKIRRDGPVVIETPSGLIRIMDGGERGRLVIELPDDMVAHVGEERALKRAKFLRRDADGKLVPIFRLLSPVIDRETGALVGVRPPGRLTVNA